MMFLIMFSLGFIAGLVYGRAKLLSMVLFVFAIFLASGLIHMNW